jgi:hypothetical protein
VERQSRGGSGGDWSPKVAVGAGGPDTEETPLDAP